jgi:hypothetical protein
VPGICGCGVADTDSDSDGIPDCNDDCDNSIDSDGDGTSDCDDLCPYDPNKTQPGVCGCSIADDDSDQDGTLDCIDTDDDGDGLPDGEEQGPGRDNPNYDGNGDGIPDRLQDNVASFHTYNDLNYVTMESPAGTTISGCKSLKNPSPSNSPEDVSFPWGFFEFTISGVAPNASISVIIYYTGYTFDTYYRYGPTPSDQTNHWYQFMDNGLTGAQIAADKITLKFINGDRGDDDLDGTNSFIIDAGGPGNINTQPPPSGDGGGGGGCFIATVAE